MIHVALQCPHCHTEKANFTGTHYVQFQPGIIVYIMLLQCQVCRDGIVAKFKGRDFVNWVAGDSGSGDTELIEVWPKHEAATAPKHIPDNVRNFYLQAIDSLARRNFDAAGTMFRKSLDVALKQIHPSGKGTLKQRIDSLPAEIGVTPAMKEWAHDIRDIGNDAAHEEEPFTETAAKALQSFTELFLTYTFTLPGMLAERKSPT